MKRGYGLDIDAPPAAFVERPRYGMLIGTVGPDIDVEPTLHIAQGAVKHDVLKVLLIRDEGHQKSILMLGGAQVVPTKSALS
jgi:hypothetical protein